MLHLFKVNRFAREVFEVMHDNLFAIRHKHGNSVIFRILLQTSFSLLNLELDLLEARQIDLVQDFVLHLLKIFFLKFYLILNRLDLFVEAIDFFFVDRDVLDLVAH